MYTAKTVAYAIIFGNCIGFFLWSSILAPGPAEQPGINVNDTGSITGLKIPYQGKEPRTAKLEVLDYIIGLWFVFSTAWALWVLLNPVIS
jgi:hypothetical protein